MIDSIGTNQPNVNIKRACPFFFSVDNLSAALNRLFAARGIDSRPTFEAEEIRNRIRKRMSLHKPFRISHLRQFVSAMLAHPRFRKAKRSTPAIDSCQLSDKKTRVTCSFAVTCGIRQPQGLVWSNSRSSHHRWWRRGCGRSRSTGRRGTSPGCRRRRPRPGRPSPRRRPGRRGPGCN